MGVLPRLGECMYLLGVWDGHDSGAALIEGNKILYAANEERFTGRKLEVAFPRKSISAALEYTGLKPGDIEVVAFPTTELTKTISRIFPWQKENYYKFRRRKMLKPRLETLMRFTKYSMTTIGRIPLSATISNFAVSREMRRIGFSDFKIFPVEHHTAHAATAAFTSGHKKGLVVTIDGLGDGLSGSISSFANGSLERLAEIPARDSIGIFYEQVTNILGMRELEDEGKVMAMADYSFPFKFEENKLKDFFEVKDCSILAKYGPLKQYDALNRISWSMPREQFAYMAQQLLEHVLQQFFAQLHERYGFSNLSLSGGIMSNVKANMKIRELDLFNSIYVFPHMGDGGIALGAAMWANYELNGVSAYDFNIYLGDEYDEDNILSMLRKEKGIDFALESDTHSHAAELIEKDNYIFWYSGRMEYGPRALGNRSILAKADSETVKEKLNIMVKQREWFQPFAPSMLQEDASKLLEDVKEYNKFMTMAYRVKKGRSEIMRSVMHVDMTARPQMVGNENRQYRGILSGVKKESGYGVLLNTSFNIHGQPIVRTPEDAIDTMKKTKTKYMFLNGFFVENKLSR